MISTQFNLIQAIGWALVHFVWQGALIGVVSALVLHSLRCSKPQARYLVASGALLLCILLPTISVFQNTNLSQIESTYFSGMSALSNQVASQNLLTQFSSWIQSNMKWIVLWWALVVLILSVRFSLGLLWLRGYQNGQRGVSDEFWQNKVDHIVQQFGLSQRVILRVVNDIKSPITIGFIRPMVLLPASLLTGMSPQLLEALIAHEIAHISRFDYAINLIQNLIEMVLFFHPAVWWISKKIRIERENIADDLAASHLGEPRRLALALQELDHIQFTTPQLAQAAQGGHLMSRIKRLIRPEMNGSQGKTAVMVVVIVAVCLSVAAFVIVPLMKEKPSTQGAGNEKPQDSQVNNLPASKVKESVLKDGVKVARIDFEKEGCRPEYPRVSLRNEETGMTTLRVSSSVEGKITNVEILESSKHLNLDNAVKDKLLSGSCIVKPGTNNGEISATTTQVQYLWKLD